MLCFFFKETLHLDFVCKQRFCIKTRNKIEDVYEDIKDIKEKVKLALWTNLLSTRYSCINYLSRLW